MSRRCLKVQQGHAASSRYASRHVFKKASVVGPLLCRLASHEILRMLSFNSTVAGQCIDGRLTEKCRTTIEKTDNLSADAKWQSMFEPASDRSNPISISGESPSSKVTSTRAPGPAYLDRPGQPSRIDNVH